MKRVKGLNASSMYNLPTKWISEWHWCLLYRRVTNTTDCCVPGCAIKTVLHNSLCYKRSMMKNLGRIIFNNKKERIFSLHTKPFVSLLSVNMRSLSSVHSNKSLSNEWLAIKWWGKQGDVIWYYLVTYRGGSRSAAPERAKMSLTSQHIFGRVTLNCHHSAS